MEEKLTIVFIYSRDFAERVIRNLINDPSFCNPCGLHCDSCKYGVYSYVHNVIAAIELPDPSRLPIFIEDTKKYLPKKIPEADLCIASGLHKDLLLDLPSSLEKWGVKGLLVPIENFIEVPSGLRKQLREKCLQLGLENAFPKPFCSLEPSKENPIISKFVNNFKVGKPLLEISTVKKRGLETIESTVVKRSAPCGSTWYVARKLIGLENKREPLYDAVAKAHHSYPCTATMELDPEEEEPILHIAGHIIREEVKNALERT